MNRPKNDAGSVRECLMNIADGGWLRRRPEDEQLVAGGLRAWGCRPEDLPGRRFGPRCIALLAVLGWSRAAEAAVVVSGTVRPVGGSYRYELTIGNSGPDDLALVSLTDAPLGDPLIGASVACPAGFTASYDSGLGFLDFTGLLGDFLAGTSIGVFAFESLAGPGSSFTVFEALDVNGVGERGIVSFTLVPEPGAAGTALALGLALSAYVRRSRPASPSPGRAAEGRLAAVGPGRPA